MNDPIPHPPHFGDSPSETDAARGHPSRNVNPLIPSRWLSFCIPPPHLPPPLTIRKLPVLVVQLAWIFYVDPVFGAPVFSRRAEFIRLFYRPESQIFRPIISDEAETRVRISDMEVNLGICFCRMAMGYSLNPSPPVPSHRRLASLTIQR